VACWFELITDALASRGEGWTDAVRTTLTPEELMREFDAGYGGVEGAAFTLWTNKHVYFPAVYDGAEWVTSVPRDPCNERKEHVGGW